MEYLQSEIKRREILMPHVMGKTQIKRREILMPHVMGKTPGKTQSVSGSFKELNGGGDRDRTCDIQLAKLALYQLSYTPI